MDQYLRGKAIFIHRYNLEEQKILPLC